MVWKSQNYLIKKVLMFKKNTFILICGAINLLLLVDSFLTLKVINATGNQRIQICLSTTALYFIALILMSHKESEKKQ